MLRGGLPYIPFAVGFGRSGPSRTRPRTSRSCHPQHIPDPSVTGVPKTVVATFIHEGYRRRAVLTKQSQISRLIPLKALTYVDWDGCRSGTFSLLVPEPVDSADSLGGLHA